MQLEAGQYIFVSISCRNLKNQDFLLNKSDPFVKVFLSSTEKGAFQQVDQTEVKFNELNPNFDKAIRLPYFFEKRQFVQFAIFDKDPGGLNDDDELGVAQTEVSSMMGADNQTLILDIKNKGEPAGKLITRCQAQRQGAITATMVWRGAKIANVDSVFDFWDKSDPYLKFIRKRGDGSKVVVATTEVIKDSLNPSWRPISIQLDRLTGGDLKTRFAIECWDEEEESEHQLIGGAQLSIQQLTAKSQSKAPVELQNPKIKKPGVVVCDSLVLEKSFSFMDFLKGGLKLSMVACIDFTGSNGHPKDVGTLHYMDPRQPNRYQLALFSVAQILLSYSPNPLIPCFGFGAKLRTQPAVSHCFPLSLRGDVMAANGLPELMAMYGNVLTSVDFSGPTLFCPVLSQSIQLCKGLMSTGPMNYQVVLILTDGCINDMGPTVDLICQASLLPMSIIIVGIGQADFSNMNKLDGDSGLFSSKGERCPRDIVQFVPFNRVANDKERLREQVLNELPKQVEQYFKMRGIIPPTEKAVGVGDVVNPLLQLNIA